MGKVPSHESLIFLPIFRSQVIKSPITRYLQLILHYSFSHTLSSACTHPKTLATLPVGIWGRCVCNILPNNKCLAQYTSLYIFYLYAAWSYDVLNFCSYLNNHGADCCFETSFPLLIYAKGGVVPFDSF
jgi:hypothetical protein